MTQKNTVFVIHTKPTMYEVAAAVGNPSHVNQVSLFAVAPTKKALSKMLAEYGYRARVESSVNEKFAIWRGLVARGIDLSGSPAIYAYPLNAGSDIVRLDPHGAITLIARCVGYDNSHFAHTPMYVAA